MERMEGYENAQAMNAGERESIEPGGYICRIIGAEERLSRNNKKMLVIYFDIAEGEKAINYLKGLMDTLKESNPGFEWDWDERKLAGLKFGGLFGREEYEKQDGTGTTFATKLRFIRTVDFIVKGNYEVPADRLLQRTENPFVTNTNPFGNTADNEDTLPF